jgi:DNA-directed RNA polymerase specialized sigma24 family protein
LIDHIEIFRKIRSDSDERHEAIKLLASEDVLKSDIIAHVVKNSGKVDDGLMIFHDAIIVFVKKVFSDRTFVLNSSLSGYVFGIAKLLWLAKLRKEAKNISKYAEEIDGSSNIPDIEIDLYTINDRANILNRIMSHLRSNCKEVLMYWAGGYSMKEIAELLGYKSEGMVRKKKCECYKELIKWLEEHPQIKNELKN